MYWGETSGPAVAAVVVGIGAVEASVAAVAAVVALTGGAWGNLPRVNLKGEKSTLRNITRSSFAMAAAAVVVPLLLELVLLRLVVASVVLHQCVAVDRGPSLPISHTPWSLCRPEATPKDSTCARTHLRAPRLCHIADRTGAMRSQ